MKSSILIKGGTVVNDDAMTKADVLIEGGKIVSVGTDLKAPSKDTIVLDATEQLVMPGGIDPHTHMQLPFMGTTAVDDFYYGTRAAVAGGTTMIIDFVIPARGESLIAAYDKWVSWAKPKVVCDYAFSVAVTYWNDKVKEEMTTLVKDYGINSFKFFMAYKDVMMIRDDEMYSAFQHCRRLGAFARVHAENGDVIAEKQKQLLKDGIHGPEGHRQCRPEILEAEATNRACVLAHQANCPLYVVHVMCKGASQAISDHRAKGAVVFGEPIAAGLGCDGSNYYHTCWRHAAGHVLSPPLSEELDTPDVLMDQLASGQLHLVGTDNCTFNAAQKALGKDDFTKIPNGINGVEDRMAVVWEKGVHSGKMDPMRFVAVTSSTAARIFNIYPQKGRIAAGSDADVVIWNPKEGKTISVHTHHQAVDFNIFEGMRVNGTATVTIAGGKIVWQDGTVTVERGVGRLIPLPAECAYVFSSTRQREQVVHARKVHREPYVPGKENMSTGEAAEEKMAALTIEHGTRSGVKNQQDSSFDLSGKQVGDEVSRPSSKVSQPPGGASKGLW